MLRKYMVIVLFAAFTLVACDNGGYDTRTGDTQTGEGTEPNTGTAGTSPEMQEDPEMGAPRERDMDTRTGGIRTRPGAGSEVDPDTGIDYGVGGDSGTGSIPESTPQGGGMGTEGTTGNTTDDTTGSP